MLSTESPLPSSELNYVAVICLRIRLVDNSGMNVVERESSRATTDIFWLRISTYSLECIPFTSIFSTFDPQLFAIEDPSTIRTTFLFLDLSNFIKRMRTGLWYRFSRRLMCCLTRYYFNWVSSLPLSSQRCVHFFTSSMN